MYKDPTPNFQAIREVTSLRQILKLASAKHLVLKHSQFRIISSLRPSGKLSQTTINHLGWMVQNVKKNAYALKTPHVVSAQPYSSVASLASPLHSHQWFQDLKSLSLKTHPWETFLGLVTLTSEPDLRNWPRYPSTWPTCWNSGPYVCPFSRESGNRHTHTQTDTWCQNYYTLRWHGV